MTLSQLLFAALSCISLAAAAADAGPLGTSESVAEPVFGGKVTIYRAGAREGTPVVLVHGLGQNGARDWGKLIPALAAKYDVYALDLPGFGESDKGNQLYSPANFVRVIEAVIGARVGRPFVLIGHSMGGAVSLAYTAAYPQRVSRLILVDMAGVLHRSVYAEFLGRLAAQYATGVYPPADAPWFNALARQVLTKVEAIPLAGELVLGVPAMRQRMLRGDPNAIAAYALVEHDFGRALREVRAPTLLIWGSDDRVAPLRTGQMAAALIPEARLAVIEGTGHMPMLQAMSKFNALVLDELQGRLQLAPFALPRAPLQGTRTGRCKGQRGEKFTGDYKELVVESCSEVQITNARIGSLALSHSSVRMVNSEVLEWLDAKHSKLEITAGRVAATGDSPALALTASSVDAAGTRFESAASMVENRGAEPVVVWFSVAETVRGGAPRSVHEVVTVPPYRSWSGER